MSLPQRGAGGAGGTSGGKPGGKGGAGGAGGGGGSIRGKSMIPMLAPPAAVAPPPELTIMAPAPGPAPATAPATATFAVPAVVPGPAPSPAPGPAPDPPPLSTLTQITEGSLTPFAFSLLCIIIEARRVFLFCKWKRNVILDYPLLKEKK